MGNDECYIFREWTPPSPPPIYVKIVRTVYVITTAPPGDMSERLKEALRHLGNVNIAPSIVIVYNRTYKRCHKELCHKTSSYDLIDANRHTAQHAQAHFPGESICIMEDDFQWTDVSTAATHLEHVRDFVKKKAQVMDHYSLGSLSFPFGVWPISWNLRHWCIQKGGWFQSVIHTPRGIDKLASIPFCIDDKSDERDIGIDTVCIEENVTYMYFMPLTVQPINDSHNQKENWGKKLWGQIGTRFARQWKMHEDPRRGTYAVYILVVVLPLCLMIVIGAILIACIVSRKV